MNIDQEYSRMIEWLSSMNENQNTDQWTLLLCKPSKRGHQPAGWLEFAYRKKVGRAEESYMGVRLTEVC